MKTKKNVSNLIIQIHWGIVLCYLAGFAVLATGILGIRATVVTASLVTEAKMDLHTILEGHLNQMDYNFPCNLIIDFDDNTKMGFSKMGSDITVFVWKRQGSIFKYAGKSNIDCPGFDLIYKIKKYEIIEKKQITFQREPRLQNLIIFGFIVFVVALFVLIIATTATISSLCEHKKDQ